MILRWHLKGSRGDFYPARALAEWFFVVAGVFFNAGHFSILFSLVLCPMVVVLRHLGLKRPWSVPVTGIWVLLLLFALDTFSILILFLHHAGWIHLLVWLVLSACGGLLVRRFPVARLRPYHGVMIAMLVVLFAQTTLLNKGPTAAACARDKREMDLAFVLEHRDFPGLHMSPRFLFTDPQEENLFVGYRFPFINHHEEAECKYGMIRVDLAGTGDANPVPLECGEAIGMAPDPWAGGVAAVLVYKPKKPRRWEHNDRVGSWLAWIGPEGTVEREVPLPDVPWNDYYCSVLPTPDAIWVYCGGASGMLVYERSPDRLYRHPSSPGPGFFLAHTNHALAEGRFCAGYGGSVLNLMVQPGIAVLDLPGLEVLHRSSRFLCGTHDLAYDPAGQKLYANSFWSGTVQVLDLDLQRVRKVRIGGLVRALALDTERRRGYALRYLTGELFSFDLDSGEIRGSKRNSKGGRALRVLRNGDILVASGCGVTRVNPEALTP